MHALSTDRSRWLSATLLLCLLVNFAACTDGDSNSASDATADTAPVDVAPDSATSDLIPDTALLDAAMVADAAAHDSATITDTALLDVVTIADAALLDVAAIADSSACVDGYTSGDSCAPFTVCQPNEYQTAPPTTTTDRKCAPVTTCTGLRYESKAPTATSDRQCSDLSTCTGSQYESKAPTATSDRQCSDLATCTGEQYEFKAPTATSDRQCLPISLCAPGSQYETKAPTPTSDRECQTLTKCTGSQYETIAPTETSDRHCAPLTICDSDSQWQKTPPTPTSDRECVDYDCGGKPQVAPGATCLVADGLSCATLTDGSTSTSTTVDCSASSGTPGCSDANQIENVDITYDFGKTVTLSGVRFMSEWYNYRPHTYEIWVSDSATDLPGAGATLVAKTTAHHSPWRCVDGELCDYATPDACCPNGRDQPQDTSVVGTGQPKYDIFGFPPATARYWHLRIVSSLAQQVSLYELEFLTSPCVPDTCGNGICQAGEGETCSTCAADCACSDGKSCLVDKCVNNPRCGNGDCEAAIGENCSTCSADCACGQDTICNNGSCLSVTP